jgi:hypothetical protein
MSMGTAVIRFKCPNCGRYYEVSQVLQHLPLLCKGCGQRIDVPDTSQEPEPAATPIPEPLSPPATANKSLGVAAARPPIQTSVGEVPAKSVTTGENTADVLPQTEAQTEMAGQKKEMIPTSFVPISHDEEASESTVKMKPLPIVVDAMIGLLLLLVGGLIGEVLAKKSTGDVWREAGSAPKFPPIDLLLWLAPTIMLMLIYYLLITRRKSLGAWLQKRNQN